MKIKTNDFSVQFFKYKDKNNWFSAAVIDNSYHFADGFTVDIVIVTNGVEREHEVYFFTQWEAFCLVHSFFNNFFGVNMNITLNTKERENYYALGGTDALQDRMYQENSGTYLRYTKRITASAWVRYTMDEAKFRGRLAALRECKKWHDKGRIAYIVCSGQAYACYEYYVTHD